MNQLHGIFIECNERELEMIWVLMDELGCEKSGTGIKKFLLETSVKMDEEDPADSVAGQINDFMEEHPELVDAAARTISTLQKLARSKLGMR